MAPKRIDVPKVTMDPDYYRGKFREMDDKELLVQIDWIAESIDSLQRHIDKMVNLLRHHPEDIKYIARNQDEMSERTMYQKLLHEEQRQRQQEADE